jgi:hypothetical protein
MTDDPKPENDDDDAEARRRRAKRLHEKIDALRGGERPPPRTPREFVDREAEKQARDE